MMPIHRAKTSVFNYDEIPVGYYHQAMLTGSPVQRFWHRQKFLKVAGLIPTVSSQGGPKRIKVVDIGCGPGSFLSVLAESRSDVEAIGVDMALRQIEYAARVVGSQFPDGRLRFLGLDPAAGALPFDDQSVDVVTCIEVIEHIHPYLATKILADIRRILKPTGKLLITTPNYRSLWPALEFALERLSPVKYHDQHINKYTPNALVKFLEAAGFSLKRIETFFVFSPFLSLLSENLALRLLKFEGKLPIHVGSLLLADCRVESFAEG